MSHEHTNNITQISVTAHTHHIALIALSTTCPHEQSVLVFPVGPAWVSHLHRQAPPEHSNDASSSTEKGVCRKSIWACVIFVVNACLLAIITILKDGYLAGKKLIRTKSRMR